MTDDGVRLNATDGETTVTADVDVTRGGRIRQVRIRRGDDQVELLAASPEAGRSAGTSWGSFPMAPWAGRLRHGRFVVDGRVVRIDLNHEDGGGVGGGRVDPPVPAPVGDITASHSAWRQHALHGTTFQRSWLVDALEADRCELHCPIDTAAGWPFAGIARQSIVVASHHIEFTLSVDADPGTTFPATIGWHPWFAKPSRLEFAPTAMYQPDEIGLPSGALVAPPPGPWDDCFVNVEPVQLVYERELAPIISVTSDCDHLVVFDAPTHATCVEPQSGPPDALNIRPEVVSSDSPLRRTMAWSW